MAVVIPKADTLPLEQMDDTNSKLVGVAQAVVVVVGDPKVE